MNYSDFEFSLVALLFCLFLLALAAILVYIRYWTLRLRMMRMLSLPPSIGTHQKSTRSYLIPATISIIALTLIYRTNVTIRQSQGEKSDFLSTRTVESEFATQIPDDAPIEELIILENRFLFGQLSHFPKQSTIEEPNRAACRHILRIANVGHTEELVVSYDVVVEYGTRRMVISNSNGGIAIDKNNLTESIGEFYTIFPDDGLLATDSNFRVSPYEKPLLSFPIQVKSFDVISVVAELGLKVAGGVYTFKNPMFVDDASVEEDYRALMVRYVLYTNSGKQVSSTASPCWLLNR